MSTSRALADRLEIEALTGAFAQALRLRDPDRLASLFTRDGAVRIPHAHEEVAGPDAIRAGIERLEGVWDGDLQTEITLNGDEAVGRARIAKLTQLGDGTSELTSCVYRDRYRRTPVGWKFSERVYEVRALHVAAPATACGARAPA